MKILIVPDSFKGTLTSKQVCECIEKGIREANNSVEITSIPFADGGEGFAECLGNMCNGEILYSKCTDLYGRSIRAAAFTAGKAVVTECAYAAGLQDKRDVMNATSYGVGELIKRLVQKGFKEITLGLGGTGSCDGGAGALSALGAVFYDEYSNQIKAPKGRDLTRIYAADFTNCVKDISFTYACDVDNTLYGENGAAYIFAPQKGAAENDVRELDEGLKNLNCHLPRDVSKLKGGGAAGGICAGLYSVYGGKIESGFDILARACRLEEKISNADIVITGEGRTDRQTLMGKLPYKISRLCAKYKKQCVVISGSIEDVKIGDKMISLTGGGITAEYAMKNAASVLTSKAEALFK